MIDHLVERRRCLKLALLFVTISLSFGFLACGTDSSPPRPAQAKRLQIKDLVDLSNFLYGLFQDRSEIAERLEKATELGRAREYGRALLALAGLDTRAAITPALIQRHLEQSRVRHAAEMQRHVDMLNICVGRCELE